VAPSTAGDGGERDQTGDEAGKPISCEAHEELTSLQEATPATIFGRCAGSIMP